MASKTARIQPQEWITPGLFWFIIATLGAGAFFADGIEALRSAWALPEYSHGPLIPVLSALLFLRQLKEYPVDNGRKRHRWVGVTVILAALFIGGAGRLANIADVVAYATILWIGGMLLVSFGWATGKHFWPPVLHLVYMLPLPGVIYYKLSTKLQLVSSELGVWLLKLVGVPVFLDGNIIDLGVLQLHVAEACSGLRYLFPILSFSYIFAVLYRGPMWHKAVLLVSAAPITVVMNSVRIAVAGMIAQYYGIDWLNGFTHFFEGWVIFVSCILLLFALTSIMLRFQRVKMSLPQALDLDTEGLITQIGRLRFVKASGAMVLTTTIVVFATTVFLALPDRSHVPIARKSFESFPRAFGDWTQIDSPRVLSENIARQLGADDYHAVLFTRPGDGAPVEFFSAWYEDQSEGGVHSPEICLPSSGWEIASLERANIGTSMNFHIPFEINRAIIQKGRTRMMVFYWFDQKGRKVAWDYEAKFWLMVDGIRTGRTDGALVRLTTQIDDNEETYNAERRLYSFLFEVIDLIPPFIPQADRIVR